MHGETGDEGKGLECGHRSEAALFTTHNVFLWRSQP